MDIELIGMGIEVNSTDVNTAKTSLGELAQQAGKTETATEKMSREFQKLEKELNPVNTATSKLEQAQEKLTKDYDAGRAALDKYDKTLKQVDQTYGKSAGGGMAKMRGVMGNLGYQIQDVAVQMQMGTDAMVIFGQQGSQIASAFGPGGAVLGAVIAVGSAIGGVFLSSLVEGNDELDEFQDNIDGIFQSLDSVQLRGVDKQIEMQTEAVSKANVEYLKLSNTAPETLSVLQKMFMSREDIRDREKSNIEENSKASSKAYQTLIEQQETLNKLQEERNEIIDRMQGIDNEEKVAQRKQKTLDSLIASLQLEAETMDKGTKATALYKASLLGASEAEIALIEKHGTAIELAEKKRKKEVEAQKATRKANQEQAKLINEYNRLEKQLDPVSAKIREITGQQEFLWSMAMKGLADPEQVERLIDLLDDQLYSGGETVGDTFSSAFLSRTDTIGDSIQDAFIQGNWAGIGDTVGAIFAGATADAVSSSLVKTLGSSSFASVLSPVLGGIAGGLVGSLFTGSLFGDEIIDPTEGRQSSQGTGDVLGSLDEKADSITRSNDLIADATNELVNINTNMLRALEGVNQSITGFSTDFSKGVFSEIQGLTSSQLRESAGSFFDPGTADLNSDSFIDRITAEVIQSIGSGRLRVLDTGVSIIGGSITEVLESTLLEAYVDVSRARDLGSDKFTSVGVDLGEDITTQYQSVLQGIVDTVTEGADVLGIDPKVVSDALAETMITAQELSLQDMDFDELNSTFKSLFGEAFNDLSVSVIPYLEELRQGGEEFGETLSRVTTQFELGKEAASVLGFEVGETMAERWGEALTALIPFGETLGNLPVPMEALVLAADDLVNKTGGIEAFSSALAGYEKNFLSAEEQTENLSRRLGEAMGDLPLPETREGFKELMESQQEWTETGRENIATLLQLQGQADQYYDLLEEGLDESGDAIETFADRTKSLMDQFTNTFAPEVYKQETALTELNAALSSLGLSIPENRDGFWDLMQALDDSTESGQDAITTLLNVQGYADQYYTNLEGLAESAAQKAKQALDDIQNAAVSASDNALAGLKRAIDAAKDPLRSNYDDSRNDAIARHQAKIEKIRDDLESSITAVEDVEKARLTANTLALNAARDGLRDISSEVRGITSALDSLSSSSISNSVLRAEAIATLRHALATGDFSGAGSAARVAANVDASNYATATDFARAQGISRSLLTELEEKGLSQQTTAERSISALQDQTKAIKDHADRQISAIKLAGEDALEAEDERHEYTLERMKGFFDAEIERLDNIYSNAQDQLKVLRGFDTSITSVSVALGNLKNALDVEKGALELSPEEARQQQLAEKYGGRTIGIRGFANGGYHSGGWRIVGERGPELEYTSQSRIVNNNDSKKLLSQDELRSEVRELKDELRAANIELVKSSKKTAKVLEKWDGGGQPKVRT